MMNAKRSSGIKLTRYAFLVPAVVALLLVFSISKAELVTKSNKALTALKLTLTKNNLFIATANGVKSANVLKTDNIKAKNYDTVRNGGLFVSTPEGDSIKFVINGVKATKAAFKALNPKEVASVDALSAEEANKVLDQTGNKNTVLFVTTSNSEAGKKFKEKLDKLTNKSFDADREDVASSYSSGSSNRSFSTTSGNGNDTGKKTVITSNVIFVQTVPELKYTAFSNSKLDTVVVKGHAKKLMLTKFTGKGSVIYFNSADSGASTINKSTGGSNALVFANSKNKTYSNEPIIVQAYSSSGTPKAITINGAYHNHVTDINNIQSKLIMIDGKEASEKDLKKLSASEIQSLSVKSGDDITEKYGDKAKNGVLFITTKKSN